MGLARGHGDDGPDDGVPPWSIPPDRLAALVTAIQRADFDVIRARPFEGTCPTAYDGHEVTTTFFVRGNKVVVSSCEVRVDAAESPWKELDAALARG